VEHTVGGTRCGHIFYRVVSGNADEYVCTTADVASHLEHPSLRHVFSSPLLTHRAGLCRPAGMDFW